MYEVDDYDYRGFRLPSGQTVGDVIRQERAGLERNARRALDNAQPSEIGPITGYSLLGDFVQRARSGGVMDFKNNFRGKEDATKLGKAGNFAYYAVGDGFFPRGLLDFGAAGYALWQLATGQKVPSDITLPKLIDKRAYSVRDKALSLPDDPP
jgi:hypothetical protein